MTPRPEPDPALVARLSLSVTRLARVLRQQEPARSSPAAAAALATIVRRGPITLGDLAAAEQVAPPSITKVATKLVDAGLAQRRADDGDRRVVWIELTELGRTHLAESRRRRTTWLAGRLRDFTDDELACLERAAELIQRVVTPDVPAEAMRP